MTNLRNTSPDPYVTLRTLYGLSRESEIRNGRLDVQELPDFADPLAGEGPMEKPTP
jgi:ABC-type transporter lipoprotein component MlaA